MHSSQFDCHPLIVTARDTIARHSLLSPGDRVVVALSGGADSVALLAVLVALGYECIAAHCNFHLRGDESQRDMLHAQSVARQLGVDFAVRDFDVAARRAATGESVEMACRSLRYDWFEQLMADNRARAVAVGHHLEDNIETFFLNLMRGTGIDGLTGIKYKRDFVIRPLLDCSRALIEDYLALGGLYFITDSSNSSDRFLRNRLRNNILPLISDQFPNAADAVLTTMEHLGASARICRRFYDSCRSRYVRSDGSVALHDMIDCLGVDTPTVLRQLLKPFGLSATQISDIIAADGRSGQKFYSSSGYTLEVDRGIIRVSDPGTLKHGTAFCITLDRDILSPVHLRISRHPVSSFHPVRDPMTIHLDASALTHPGQWQIRQWRKGDRIKSFGMRGSQLVSDIFSNAKLSADQKRNTWLLTCGGEIIWVIGLRASRHFMITPGTAQFITITLNDAT